jgi:hypothetical protein
MNKKTLTEADIRTKFITPALAGADGRKWDVMTQLREVDQIVLVHALSKKAQQLKKQDIDLAERRMEDWMRRFPAGGETRKKAKFGHSKAGCGKT